MGYLGNTPTTQSFTSGTDYFNGTGSQTAFTLSRSVNSVNDIQVTVNNVVQQPNDAYTVSGTTLTMTSAPSSGTNNVYVRYLSTTTQTITPSSGVALSAALGTASSPSYSFIGDSNTGIFSPAADTIAFAEGGTEVMRINSSGNVGIGTSSPQSLLDLTGNDPTIRLTDNGGSPTATFSMRSADATYRIRDVTNGADRLTIDSSGNVGIGTTSPARNLTVKGSTGIAAERDIDTDRLIMTYDGINQFANASGGGNYNNLTFTQSNNSGSKERMRITSGGSLEFASDAGILQLATNQTMRIPSTGGISYVGNINSATVFQIAYNSTSSGVQLSSGATSWGTFSDSRLKNITGTYTNALNDIAQIQPVKFTWKADKDSKPQVGVIAQSIQNVVPEAVDSTTIEMNGTEEYLTIRYTELIPLMIAAIQELNEKVEAQAAEIAALKGANNAS